MADREKLFKGKCPHCAYAVQAYSFQAACEELIAHLQQEHAEELHKICSQALNRAVLQGISCVLD